MTIFTSDIGIARIGAGLLDHSLPKAEWTHAAHFAATLWLARHHPALLAPAAIGAIIRGYNIATGVANTDTGGYHETITVASVRAAQAPAARWSVDTPLHVILGDLLASPYGRSGWLLNHWRRDTLFSVAARRDWVAPDLSPLLF